MKAMLFDFAGTLADLEPQRASIVTDYLMQHCGIVIGHDKIQESYRIADLIAHYSSIVIRDEQGRRSFFLGYNALLFNLLGVSHFADAEALFEVFNASKTHWSLKPGARDILRLLKDRGLTVGVLSNFDSRLHEVVYGDLALGNLVDHVHVSQPLGVEKPDPMFYTTFLEQHGLRAADVSYCGDNYILDFLPTLRLGMSPVLLDEAAAYTHLRDAIRSLAALPDMLLARTFRAIDSHPGFHESP